MLEPGKFDDKTPGETLWEVVSFENRLVAGVTIGNCSVTVDVSEDSAVDDPNASAILSGTAEVNEDPFTIKIGKPAVLVTVAAGVAVKQLVTAGVPGCLYLLTYTAVLSTGETIERCMLLYVLPSQAKS